MESIVASEAPRLSNVLDNIDIRNLAGGDAAHLSFLVAAEIARQRFEFQPDNLLYRHEKAIACGELAIYETTYILRPSFSYEVT